MSESAQKSKRSLRSRLAPLLVVAVSFTMALYLYEIYLLVAFPVESKAAHVEERRADGAQVYPSVFPSGFMDRWRRTGEIAPLVVDGDSVLPLGGIPEVDTAYCRTLEGEWIEYRADRYGFRNEPWGPLESAPSLALLGDSFVQGTCVEADETLTARLDRRGDALSFGMNSTSVVTQYAIYEEFIAPLEPRRLVWFFFEGNDLFDLRFELEFPLLSVYASEGSLQDLATRSERVGLEMRRYVDEALESQAVSYVTHDVQRPFRQRVREFVTLQRTKFQLAKSPIFGKVRSLLGLEFAVIEESAIEAADWETIEKLWRAVADEQASFGGEVAFVYLPDAYRFMGEVTGAWWSVESRAMEIWGRMGVPHVSVAAHLELRDEPLSLYDGSHFSPEGYKIASEIVAACLDDARRCTPERGEAPEGP